MSNNKSFQIKKLITPGIIASLIAVLLYIFSISLPETLLQLFSDRQYDNTISNDYYWSNALNIYQENDAR